MINKVILVGNLGADPETRYAPSGSAITNIRIATTESWKDRQTGERKEKTEWHRVVFFDKLAEIAGEYLRKGSQVYVEGRLQTRKWQDKEGKDQYTTEIRVDEMKMLGGRAGGGEGRYDGGENAGGGGFQRQGAGGGAVGESGGGGYQRQPARPQPAARPQAAPAYEDAPSSASFDDDIPF